ncbi:MAG: DUF1501 domain-containing protein [Planctomycetaceae bacterium]
MPQLADRSDKYSVIRTLNHSQNDHNGTHIIQTGRPIPPADRGADNVNATTRDWPAYGPVVSYLDQQARSFGRFSALRLPAAAVGAFRRLRHQRAVRRLAGECLEPHGHAHSARNSADNPFFRDCTDEELDFRLNGLESFPDVTLDRLDHRRNLLSQLDDERRRIDRLSAVRSYSGLESRALKLLSSPQIAEAFDLRREADSLRDRYGRNLFGQSLLMGRRMIEAGARFVTVAWDLAVRGDVCGSWDMHGCLTDVMRNHLLPGLDHGFSALLDDMQDRGLLEETLVLAVGEMGRTPSFKNRGNSDGRDHWSYCFPALLAGAGIRGGTLYGESDKDAAYPVTLPVSPADRGPRSFPRWECARHPHPRCTRTSGAGH